MGRITSSGHTSFMYMYMYNPVFKSTCTLPCIMLTHTHTHIPLYSWQAIIDYVNDKYDQYLRDESGLNRRNIEDHRVHCCLYFINPSGHGSVYNSPSLVVCVIFIFSLPLSLLSPPLSLSLPSSPTLSLSPFLPPPSLSFQAEAS